MGGVPGTEKGPALTTSVPEGQQSLTKKLSLIVGKPMATMTIRNIDGHRKARLRGRAARRGRSMEEEARDILRAALSSKGTGAASLVDAIHARIEPLEGSNTRGRRGSPPPGVRGVIVLDTNGLSEWISPHM
jgi:plasmid stability protein